MLFGEAPANRTAHWQPAPGTRGSMSILSSCLVTLGLCVWTSVHLNIPAHGEDKPCSRWNPQAWLSKQQWRKVYWLLAGIFAPEFVTFTAYTQWQSARKLNREMQSLLRHQTQPKSLKSAANDTDDIETCTTTTNTRHRKHAWTMIHSFYVVMGGFVFDVSDLPDAEQFLPDSARRTTIGVPAFKELAAHVPAAVPDVSTGHIRDKSNANGLSKGIVCVQATWFVIQCLVRLCTRQPITLLELNTLAHCICTLLTYAFWWYKPLDIEEALPLSDPAAFGLFASTYVGAFEHELRLDINKERQSPADDQDGHAPKPAAPYCLRRCHAGSFEGKAVLLAGQTTERFLYEPDGCCFPYRTKRTAHTPLRGVFSHRRDFKLYDQQDCRRWALASDFMLSSGKQYTYPLRMSPDLWMPARMQNLPDLSSGAVVEVLPMWHPISGQIVLNSITDPLLLTLLLTGVFYGGLHLLAWHAPFTSHVQAVLWRLSGLTVATAGFAFAVVVFLLESISGALTDAESRLSLIRWNRLWGRLWDINYHLALLWYLSSRLLYVLARIYLFVGTLIAFASPPPGVFNEPTWTWYFPHIA